MSCRTCPRTAIFLVIHQLRGRGIQRSPFAGSWIRPRNTPPRCAKPSPNLSACAVSVSAYTNNLRMPLLLGGVITPSPVPPGLSGRGYGLSFAGFGGRGVNESAAPSVFL